jgi:two-component system sensor histidine kinase/response regulator
VSTLLAHVGETSGQLLRKPGQANRDEELVEARASIVERFGGNIELIQRVLAGFEGEIDKLLVRLGEQVATTDFKGAASVSHTIKGSAGTVGAKLLAMRAGQLEHNLNQGDAATKRSVLTHECVIELQHILKLSVEQLTTAFRQLPADVPPAIVDPLSPEDWRGRLSEILSLLNASNLQAIAASEALSAHALPQQRAIFADFLVQVRALQFKQAALQARELLENS